MKKAVITSVVITSLTIGSAYANNEGSNLSTVYHVYIKGENVGTVSEKAVVEKVINEKVERAENYYSNYSFTSANEITYIPEQVFQPVYNNEIVVEKVNEQLSVVAEAVAVKVDGKSAVYVNSQQEAEEVVHQLKLRYVSEQMLNELGTNKDEIVPEIGETIILDVHLSGKVSYLEEKTYPRNILSVEKAVEYLQKGTLEPKKHIIAEGDILGRIANTYGLSLSEILKLNPSITEDTVLAIGDELVVMAYKPLVTVIVEEKTNRKEELDFKTEVIKDENMYKGDSKVKQEGKKGEKNVIFKSIKENGEVIRTEVLNETVISEPVNKVILKGTKVIPSRGTGDLAWPAVGGYISSSMGYRWGRMHKGIDIAGPSNRTIKAADNGTIEFAGWDGAYGNKVVINHNNGMKTIYGHLASISVKRGQTVERGKKIGVMGSTGRSTGTHLHFEVYKNGKLKNPKDYY